MGCSRLHTKDFIQLSKPAKKIINFVNASILLLIFTSSELDHPPTDRIPPPPGLPTSCKSFHITPHRARIYLAGCCVLSLIRGCLKPRQISCFNFFHAIHWPTWEDKILSSAPPRSRSHLLSDIPPGACHVFRLVAVCSHLMTVNYSEGSAPLANFIFRLLNLTLQMMVTRPPHMFQPGHLCSPTPTPPLTTLLFDWLL